MIGRLRHVAHRVARRVDRLLRPGGRGVILLYHRVVDEPSDPYGLCVTPADFEQHMSSIRSLGEPMSVAAMARAARDRTLPARAIGVTFDDAYVDVLENAVPVLESHEVPATVFVTTGEAGREREFWWDELERLLLQTPRLPGALEVEVAGEVRRWELGSDASRPPDREPPGGAWHILDEAVPTRRHGAFQELYLLLRPLGEEERTEVLGQLRDRVGDSLPPPRPSHRVMTPDQVGGMVASGLVDVGAHTGSHPDLTTLPPERRRQEIHGSKLELEAWIGRRVEGFAYPYGHHDERSVEEVREAGFDFACSGEWQALRPSCPPFLLPRIDVLPGDGDALGELVGRYF